MIYEKRYQYLYEIIIRFIIRSPKYYVVLQLLGDLSRWLGAIGLIKR